MSWNYRLIRHPPILPSDEAWYAIHKVYYLDEAQSDTLENIKAWTESPITVGGTAVSEVARTITLIRAALGKPILDLKELESNAKR